MIYIYKKENLTRKKENVDEEKMRKERRTL
jgi:hypothetical protein